MKLATLKGQKTWVQKTGDRLCLGLFGVAGTDVGTREQLPHVPFVPHKQKLLYSGKCCICLKSPLHLSKNHRLLGWGKPQSGGGGRCCLYPRAEVTASDLPPLLSSKGVLAICKYEDKSYSLEIAGGKTMNWVIKNILECPQATGKAPLAASRDRLALQILEAEPEPVGRSYRREESLLA